MQWRNCVLVIAATMALSGPASAGIFFNWGSGPKHDPAKRVPELLAVVKTDQDEDKRAAAADELRHYDTKQFPEIVPILIDVMLTDPKSGVRSEAAQSLGKIRPTSQEAGWALEQALAKDQSMWVRWQARTALWGYYLAGYRSLKNDQGPMLQTQEPPLADPGLPNTSALPQLQPGKSMIIQPTRPVNPGTSRPLPPGPPSPPAIPSPQPPTSGTEGPILNPPK